MEKYTKKQAQAIIDEHRDNTNYFNGTLTAREMYQMFRYRYQFGEAETMTIIGALIKCGANFKGMI